MPPVEPLVPPPNGVTVRMYRQGHGDCFLIAFPRAGGGDPYYVMIDCGYKPGSNTKEFFDTAHPIGDIVKHLHASCGGHLDLAILTHEHQDHLNGIWKSAKPYFEDFEIEEAWVAWTEDPDNDLANDLRTRHHDQLLGLLAARRELALAAGEDDPTVGRLDSLLGLELGGGSEKLNHQGIDELFAAAEDPEKSVNKQGLKLIKDKASAKKGCFYLYPGVEPVPLDGAAGIRAFILGPPESAELIADEDPRDGEGFPQDHAFSFSAAARTAPGERAGSSPFSRHFFVPLEFAFESETPFFADYYGHGETPADDRNRIEVAANASWRRIDNEWLYSAETLALKLNTGINNTSLVVAFELPNTKKILFFAADAQRGNWISWKDVKFKDGTNTITTRDLLSRAVLYKVGHHGSHNATLSGTADDDYPNLAWMGQGDAADEFTAMITAVNAWALAVKPSPWVHPLPSIKTALLTKARGRVIQTDENQPVKPGGVSDGEWGKFTGRARFEEVYFDLEVRD
jgi:beta-lactamase superfamily II metal-dependent hydrolase